MTASPRTIAQRLSEAASASFVGRDEELALLRHALETAELPFVVAFVHGPGGIGKSRLLREAVRLVGSGARAVILDCRDIEPTPPGFVGALAAALPAPGAASDLDAVRRLLGESSRRTVLVLDTYETFGLMDTWLRQVFVPALPDNVLTVIAGRFAPDPAWFTTPGWQGLFRAIELRELPEDRAQQLLESRGLAGPAIERAKRFASRHPLALELAAAALRAQPNLDLAETPPARILHQLTSVLLAGLPRDVTEAVEAASTLRRVTEPLLAAVLGVVEGRASFDKLQSLPFIDATDEGLVLHDVVRDAVASELARRAPDSYRACRQRAWRFLSGESHRAVARSLWQCTADMLYLIENPAVREGFFPVGGSAYRVEPATGPDDREIREIAAEQEPAQGAHWLLRWWDDHPEAFSVARTRDGRVAAFYVMFDPREVHADVLRGDPLTAAWQRHLDAHPVARGERVLFLRRWLSRATGEAPSAAQAACWVDIKRVYMDFRPSLRRLYTAVIDLTTYTPKVVPLRFVPLPDADAMLGEQTYHAAMLDFGPSSVDGWLAAVVGAELGIGIPTVASSRVLAAVLFTDIVGATEHAARLGDARWRDVLERHHALVRQELARFDGQEIDTAGDGFFATFQSPTRALQCTLAVSQAVQRLGLAIRAGLHIGECEVIDNKIGGIAVHIGARVAARAEPGEVWISSTMRELVVGSELHFEERGAHVLKGIPGEWRLFAVHPPR